MPRCSGLAARKSPRSGARRPRAPRVLRSAQVCIFQKGRLTADQQIAERKKHTRIFGAVEKGPNGRRLVLVKAEGTSRKALLPIIANYILPGTTIVSDELPAYKGIQQLPNYNYLHFSVCHKKNYVDPHTGRHTQGIESEWQKFKEACVKRPYGVARKHLDSYLAKHMWGIMFKGRDALYHFWSHIAKMYPCEGAPGGSSDSSGSEQQYSIADFHDESDDEDDDEELTEESTEDSSGDSSGVESQE